MPWCGWEHPGGLPGAEHTGEERLEAGDWGGAGDQRPSSGRGQLLWTSLLVLP